jgi:site-specific DNA recombinase
VTTKRGKPIDKGDLYKLLNNRVYLGEAVHKGTAYPGEHKAIIDRALWERVRTILATKAPTRAGRTRCQTPALLRGLIFGPTGCAMTPTHTRRRGKLYRYYVSMDVIKQGADACPVRRVPAGEIEAAVIDQVRALIRTPEIVVRTWRAARVRMARLARTTCWRPSSALIRYGRNCSRPSRRVSSNSWSSGWMSALTVSTFGCGPTA